MIKIVAVIRKKPGMSREEFQRHWNEDHPAYVRRLPGIRRYRQNPAVEHRAEWPFDGMAELWFDSIRAVKEAYAGEEGTALFEHEQLFLDDMQWFIAEEKEIAL